jgi:hypothetical protein
MSKLLNVVRNQFKTVIYLQKINVNLSRIIKDGENLIRLFLK